MIPSKRKIYNIHSENSANYFLNKGSILFKKWVFINWLMNRLEKYLDKRISELKQQSIQMTWRNMYLQNAVNDIRKFCLKNGYLLVGGNIEIQQS